MTFMEHYQLCFRISQKGFVFMTDKKGLSNCQVPIYENVLW